MSVSAYRVLIDEADYRDEHPKTSDRRRRTLHLLQQQPPMPPPMPQPMPQPMPLPMPPPMAPPMFQSFVEQPMGFQPLPPFNATYAKPPMFDARPLPRPLFSGYQGSRSRHGERSARHFSRRSSRRSSSKTRNRYSIRSNDSDASDWEDRVRSITMRTIKEYLPDSMHDLVYQDILTQMEEFSKQGFKLPKDYDKNKHELSANELQLYAQQVAKDRKQKKTKVEYMLKGSARAVDWLCQMAKVECLKTKQLPKKIRESIANHEFDDCVDGVSDMLKGTVFDDPIFATVMKFIEKVGEANQDALDSELEHLQDQQLQHEHKHQSTLRELNKMRQASQAANSLKKESRATEEAKSEPVEEKKNDCQGLGAIGPKPARVEKPSESWKSSEPSRVAEPPKPSRVATPSEQNHVVEPAKPSEPSKPSEASHVSEPSNASEASRVVESSSVVTPSDPNHVAEPAGGAEPAAKTRRKRTFATIPNLTVPHEVTRMMQQLQDPMEEIKSFMQDTRTLAEEIDPLARSTFSLKL